MKIDDEKEAADIMAGIVIFGGHKVGFNTNPETEKRQCFIEIKGEKIVCIAQAGECRCNYNYYSPGLNDKKSWTTPIIEESCPDRCLYKVLVCDNHEKGCEGSITYYPQYNKFYGQYQKYCRNLEKYLGKEEDREKVRSGKERSGRVKDKTNRFFYQEDRY